MNKYIIFITSFWGLPLSIGSFLNLIIKMDIYVMMWFIFGIIGFLTHLWMNYRRVYKGNTIGSKKKLIVCTLLQLLVISLYHGSRHKLLRFRLLTDFGIGLIITIMIARIFAIINGYSLIYQK